MVHICSSLALVYSDNKELHWGDRTAFKFKIKCGVGDTNGYRNGKQKSQRSTSGHYRSAALCCSSKNSFGDNKKRKK